MIRPPTGPGRELAAEKYVDVLERSRQLLSALHDNSVDSDQFAQLAYDLARDLTEAKRLRLRAQMLEDNES